MSTQTTWEPSEAARRNVERAERVRRLARREAWLCRCRKHWVVIVHVQGRKLCVKKHVLDDLAHEFDVTIVEGCQEITRPLIPQVLVHECEHLARGRKQRAEWLTWVHSDTPGEAPFVRWAKETGLA